jgi:hypothetical protein
VTHALLRRVGAEVSDSRVAPAGWSGSQ